MAALNFACTFAGIPFCLDTAKTVRMASKLPAGTPHKELPPEKHQVEPSLLEEINRILPFQYLNDFVPPSQFPGRNTAVLARQYKIGPNPTSSVKVGEYYYPTGAGRWSVFRGLATSELVKDMVALAYANGTSTAKEFILKSYPILPEATLESDYTVTTDLYMLPPRPLAEHGGKFNGLFLVTLVDERWYWQFRTTNLKPRGGSVGRTTWASLINDLADELDISIDYTVPSDYLYPEPDSQLYCNRESVPELLDAIANNIGRVFVRKLDGTYHLESNSESTTIVNTNRGSAERVVRMAGGDMFSSLTSLPAGSLATSKNAVLPATIKVTFPIYVEPNYNNTSYGDAVDPSVSGGASIPYMLNSRYANKRPSAWYEDSYGEVWVKSIAISSAGSNYTNISGIGEHTIRSTAKAIYRTEADTTPSNVTELNALALQLAKDYWDSLGLSALDEVYPGIWAWEPEGFNDVLWTYSSDRRVASTRVMRSEWNQRIAEFQHSASTIPRGVGGPSVALTIRDSFSGTISQTVTGLGSGATSCTFTSVANLPTQNRWRGIAGGLEKILFDGTSGGTTVTIAARGIDGTDMQNFIGATTVQQIEPNVNYGTNLITYEKMEFVYPGEWTSGGIQGVRKVPQTQTVIALSDEAKVIGTLNHYSGRVRSFDTTDTSYPDQEYIWIIERNEQAVISGMQYDGQIAGYSLSDPPIRPVYLVNTAEALGTVYVTLGTNQTNYSLPNARRLVITTSGRFRFFSFAPSINRKIEIINQGPEKIIFEHESQQSGTTPAGRIAVPFNPTPTLYLSGGAPEQDPNSRYQADCMLHPNQTVVLEYVGAGTSGGKYKLENPPPKHMPRTVYFDENASPGQLFYIKSGVGYSGVPKVARARANFDISGQQQWHPAMGVATNYFSGELGEIITEGPIYNVDTRNFTVGDRIYLNVSGTEFFTAKALGMSSGVSGMGSGIQQPIGHVTSVGQSGSIHVHLEPIKTVMSGDLWAKVIFSGNVASGAIIGCLYSGAPEASGIFSGDPTSSGVLDCLPYNIASGTICGCLLSSGAIHSGHLYVQGEPRAHTFLRATDEAFPGIPNFVWSQVHAANTGSGRLSGTLGIGLSVNTRQFEQIDAGINFWGSIRNLTTIAGGDSSGSPMKVTLSWSDFWGNHAYYQALLGPLDLASGETFSGQGWDAINLSGFLSFSSFYPAYQESHSGSVYQPIISASIRLENLSGPNVESLYGYNVTRIG